MKKMIFTLIAILSLALSANAMSYEQARNEALFLTDKMAYELNLTDAQYEAAYEINLDYLMGVTSRHDVFGSYWERRNLDLQYILYSWQWNAFRAATYFYRPLYWDAGYWHFGIYARYPHRAHFYFGRPHFYASYRGGHSWRMNGGRSYYEHRSHTFRPDVHRDHHQGMRDGWNRGSYRSGNHLNNNSSTRITGSRHDNHLSGSGINSRNRSDHSLSGSGINNRNRSDHSLSGSGSNSRNRSDNGFSGNNSRSHGSSMGGHTGGASSHSSVGGSSRSSVGRATTRSASGSGSHEGSSRRR